MIPLGVIQGSEKLDITIDLSSPQVNVNLNFLDRFQSEYPGVVPVSGDQITFVASTINQFVGGTQAGSPANDPDPAIRTGIWPAGVILRFDDPSVIRHLGRGGNGNGPNPGKPGGTCLLVEHPLIVNQVNGGFTGGGGGGAGTDQWDGGSTGSVTYQAGGGGGAGSTRGLGHIVTGNNINLSGSDGSPSGAADSGGAGGNPFSDPNQPTDPNVKGGDGGDYGQPGGDASDVAETGSEDNTGGRAGYSVDGFSLVTWISQGTLLGPTIN